MYAHGMSPLFWVGLVHGVFEIACVGGHQSAIIRRVTLLEQLFSLQCLQSINSRWQEFSFEPQLDTGVARSRRVHDFPHCATCFESFMLDNDAAWSAQM